MAAPLLRPSSAEKLDVWIFTSSMKLRLTLLTCDPFEPESTLDVPSMVRLLVLVRLPLIDWPVTLSDVARASGSKSVATAPGISEASSR